MSRRVLRLPSRPFPGPLTTPWTCRRCLSNETSSEPTAATTIDDPSTNQSASPVPSSRSLLTETPTQKSGTQAVSRVLDPSRPADAFRQRWHPEHNEHLPADERQRRGKIFRTLRRGLPHAIPPQHLIHVEPGALTFEEKKEREHVLRWAMPGHVNAEGELKHGNGKEVQGVVVSAGKMDRTVKVRVPGQRWEPRLKKYFNSHTNHLVHDPNNSLVIGDLVALHRLHITKQVRHVVASIVVPFGKPIEERSPIPTPEERLAEYKDKRFAKLERRSLRRKAAEGDEVSIKELRARGLDPGAGVEDDVTRDTARVPDKDSKKKGPTKGKKGQILPEGVLPDGQHEVGSINRRAVGNKRSASALKQEAGDNLFEAEEKSEDLARKGLASESVLNKAS